MTLNQLLSRVRADGVWCGSFRTRSYPSFRQSGSGYMLGVLLAVLLLEVGPVELAHGDSVVCDSVRVVMYGSRRWDKDV